jgi:hypothetical protein
VKLLFAWVVSDVASPMGVVVLAALDSTLFVPLPWGIDATVVMVAARAGWFWRAVPLLVAGGSLHPGPGVREDEERDHRHMPSLRNRRPVSS